MNIKKTKSKKQCILFKKKTIGNEICNLLLYLWRHRNISILFNSFRIMIVLSIILSLLLCFIPKSANVFLHLDANEIGIKDGTAKEFYWEEGKMEFKSFDKLSLDIFYKEQGGEIVHSWGGSLVDFLGENNDEKNDIYKDVDWISINTEPTYGNCLYYENAGEGDMYCFTEQEAMSFEEQYMPSITPMKNSEDLKEDDDYDDYFDERPPQNILLGKDGNMVIEGFPHFIVSCNDIRIQLPINCTVEMYNNMDLVAKFKTGISDKLLLKNIDGSSIFGKNYRLEVEEAANITFSMVGIHELLGIGKGELNFNYTEDSKKIDTIHVPVTIANAEGGIFAEVMQTEAGYKLDAEGEVTEAKVAKTSLFPSIYELLRNNVWVLPTALIAIIGSALTLVTKYLDLKKNDDEKREKQGK